MPFKLAEEPSSESSVVLEGAPASGVGELSKQIVVVKIASPPPLLVATTRKCKRDDGDGERVKLPNDDLE